MLTNIEMGKFAKLFIDGGMCSVSPPRISMRLRWPPPVCRCAGIMSYQRVSRCSHFLARVTQKKGSSELSVGDRVLSGGCG